MKAPLAVDESEMVDRLVRVDRRAERAAEGHQAASAHAAEYDRPLPRRSSL